MAINIKIAEYFSTIIVDDASKAYQLLAVFAKAGIGLLAFKAVPAGPGRTQFSVFPNDPEKMIHLACGNGESLVIKSTGNTAIGEGQRVPVPVFSKSFHRLAFMYTKPAG